MSCAYDKDEKLSTLFFVYFHVFDFYHIELVFGDIVCECVRIDASSSASIYQLPICFGGIQFGCYERGRGDAEFIPNKKSVCFYRRRL